MSADDVLRRQVEYFRSDDHIRRRAEPYRGLSPAECVVATAECCSAVETLFEMMEPEVRERALRPEPIPAEIIAILEAMQRT